MKENERKKVTAAVLITYTAFFLYFSVFFLFFFFLFFQSFYFFSTLFPECFPNTSLNFL